MKSDTWPVYSPFAKEHYGRGKRGGKKEGRAFGEAEAILLFLEARGLDVSEAERSRIISCTHLRQLKSWIKRAVTVERAADLFT
jgi:hypothetical protein